MRRSTRLAGTDKKKGTIWVTLFVLTAALAGCFGGDDGDDDDHPQNGHGLNGETPEPIIVTVGLTVDDAVRFTGEGFNFTGAVSGVSTENVTGYVFDAGDGSTTELDGAASLVFNHTYAEGGVYFVSLTAFALGHDNETIEGSGNVTVFVQESHEIGDGAAAASILVLREGQEWSGSWEVRSGVSFFDLTLDVSDESFQFESLSGSVTVTGPDGEVLDEKDLADGPLTLSGAVGMNDTAGEISVLVVVDDGSIEFTGTLRIFYGIDPADFGL